MSAARLVRIAGALAEATPLPDAALYELARVGRRGLLGEVIRVAGSTATLQVYEQTTALECGEPVEPPGSALTVELGPGLLGAVLDGVGRPRGRRAEQENLRLLLWGAALGAPGPLRRDRLVPSA